MLKCLLTILTQHRYIITFRYRNLSNGWVVDAQTILSGMNVDLAFSHVFMLYPSHTLSSRASYKPECLRSR